MEFKALLAGVATMVLAMGIAHAEQTVVTEKTMNADGSTTTTMHSYYFKSYDENNNGILDSAEFPRFAYTRWDRDGDGFLSDEEWQGSRSLWYPSEATTEYTTYATWDKDGNGRIDPDEFNTVVTTTKLYNTWDKNSNNVLENNEYAEQTFHIYDVNHDGNISLEEWQNVQQ